MSYPHWEYFLSIEDDLTQCVRYVEFAPDNYDTYSVEFARVIVAAASEFDGVAKELCKSIELSKSPRSINSYRPIIIGKYPKFVDHVIHIPRFKLQTQPWKDWQQGNSPEWWSSYNLIKHHRDMNFQNANLKNAIDATAGLLVGIIYLYNDSYGKFPLIEHSAAPKLLEPQDDPSLMQPAELGWTCRIWK